MPDNVTAVWQALTAIATGLYVVLVFFTLLVIYYQLKELKKSRTLHALITLFDVLQNSEARRARKYIHDNMPVKVRGLTVEELEKHLERMWEAVAAFDRIGYFLQKGYVHTDEIVPLFWAMVWRCWKKSEKLIRLTRRKRGDPIYRAGFEYFFIVSDAYREEHGYKKPRFY
ncbi:MAG: hypothetical protein US74_C0016G0002 [Parcubacteria group bacterium GW2011_GWA2_38_13]|nr:MAG: hypothetical protein US74_C0016G0002 [Parcubacteria group bacterium GW2011_GWA2_38_13]